MVRIESNGPDGKEPLAERVAGWIRVVWHAGLAAVVILGITAAVQYRGVLEDLSATARSSRNASADLAALTAEVRADYKSGDTGLYWDLLASMESSAEASRNTSELIGDVRAGLMGGRDSRGNQLKGVLPEAEGLIQNFRGVVTGMKVNLDRLTDSTDETLKPLRSTLEHLDGLIITIDRQASEGGPELRATFQEATRTIRDLDKLIASPEVEKILVHSAGTAKNIDGATESIDIALRPWRERASQLKMILGKLIGFFKITWAF